MIHTLRLNTETLLSMEVIGVRTNIKNNLITSISLNTHYKHVYTNVFLLFPQTGMFPSGLLSVEVKKQYILSVLESFHRF